MELEQRVARLERRNRILLTLIGMLAAAVIFSALRPTIQDIPDEVVARSIRVVGDAGNNEATLAATADGFVTLSLRDLLGDQRFVIMMIPSGKVGLHWFGGQRGRLDIGVIDDGQGEEFSLALKDRNGTVLWEPPVRNPY